MQGQANSAAPQAGGQTSGAGESPQCGSGSSWMLTPDEGVDFTPYMNRVWSAVRRNWIAVVPESARLGARGCVVLRFSILRNGNLAADAPQLESTSGNDDLDRAALASIRASSPFAPLPSAFSAPQIELRFFFSYNLPVNAPPGGLIGGVVGGVPGGTNSSAPLPPPSAEVPPVRMRVGGNVMKAKLVKMVEPKHPPLAWPAGSKGTVRLQLIVAKDGSVQQLEVMYGHALLVQAALDAVKQWQYQPTLLNGEPVEVVTTVDVIFSIGKQKSKKN